MNNKQNKTGNKALMFLISEAALFPMLGGRKN
jgi:hypothetical protein